MQSQGRDREVALAYLMHFNNFRPCKAQATKNFFLTFCGVHVKDTTNCFFIFIAFVNLYLSCCEVAVVIKHRKRFLKNFGYVLLLLEVACCTFCRLSVPNGHYICQIGAWAVAAFSASNGVLCYFTGSY